MILTITFLIGLLYTNPLAFLLLLAAGLAVRELFKYHYKHWERQNVPGPKPSFIFGNIASSIFFRQHIAEVCDEWYKKYPNAPFVGYFKAFKPSVMIRDPEMIKTILVKDQSCFSANDFGFDEKVDPLLAHNPFMVDGERWKKSRQVLTPIFTGSRMKQLFPTMNEVSSQFVDFIGRQCGREVEAKSISAAYTTQNVVGCAFSLDADCFNNPNSEWRVMGKKMFQTTFLVGVKFMLTFFVPALMKWFPVPFLPKEVDVWIRKLVSTLLKERQTKQPERDDQLQILLKGKSELTEEMIAGHSLSFFTEGFETSSITMAFAILHLAENPDVQEKLYQEVQRNLTENDGLLTFDLLQKIDYLDWILQESLRITPPAAALQKLCTQNYALKYEVAGKQVGTFIRPGTTVLIPIAAIHMDPQYYPEPNEFRPERFSPQEKAKRSLPVYIPFGEGPRMCLGMRFAQSQIKIALLKLVQNFRVRVSPNYKPWQFNRQTFLTEAKDGLQVIFDRR
ncbi:probable cytochrome P450 6g2 isoform X2 [Armigeres subalbatus]|uniref:probable cytochrome P450 6g2 isoform X2 n=1 Tax=Armigeres subalbatus TaxID=124917 RepID=UPI002ED0FECA